MSKVGVMIRESLAGNSPYAIDADHREQIVGCFSGG